jgi:4-diphosphocytidyl-2-C-methyl-D-erythritol kinase
VFFGNLYYTELMDKLTVFAPAKVNLHLSIKNRRSDGFHNLESLFLAVDFGDTLHFELIEGKNTNNISMEGLNSAIPPEKNIIFKALSLFREKTAFSQGINIHVEKRIPLGGGLGGGSSNAAAALLALNKLAGAPLARDTLLEMAAALGSDVPFFISETPAAWVTGRGEFITPVEAHGASLVLVNPGFSSNTAEAFSLLSEARSRKNCTRHWKRKFNHGGHRVTQSFNKISILSSVKLRVLRGRTLACWTSSRGAVKQMEKLELGKVISHFTNDFLAVFPDPEQSTYTKIITQLRECGALYANLSGAGATCFGFFADREQAEKAAEALRSSWGFVECCNTLLTM